MNDVPDHDGAGSKVGSRWFAMGLRATITLGILAALISTLPRDTLLSAFRRLPVSIWIAAAFGFFALHLVQAFKWRLLIGASGVLPSLVESIRAHYAGLFANLCLPSLVGGDLIRAGIIVQRRGNAGAVAVGSVADRLLDTTGLTLLAALGVILAPAAGSGMALKLIGIAGVGCFVIWLAALAIAFVPISLPRLLPRVQERLASPLEKVRAAVGNMLSKPGTAVVTLLMTFLVQGGFVAINAKLGSAMGIDLPFAIWLWAWSLAKITALVPISLGGIGVRELALATFLAPFGVDAGLAVAQSLVWESILIAVGASAGSLSLLLRSRTGGETGAAS